MRLSTAMHTSYSACLGRMSDSVLPLGGILTQDAPVIDASGLFVSNVMHIPPLYLCNVAHLIAGNA